MTYNSGRRFRLYNTTLNHLSYERGQIINGKSVANEILFSLKNCIEKWVQHGNRRPHLTAITVGTNPASDLFIKNKRSAADKCGITYNIIDCPDNSNECELIELIQALNFDKSVDAILVQLPLPNHINEKRLLDSICDSKDVDGFSSVNLGRIIQNEGSVIPCAALAVNALIRHIGIPTKGLQGTVVGTSRYIGLPIALSLHSSNNGETGIGLEMTTTLCNVNTTDSSLREILRRSDVIVSITGVPGIIKGDMIKEGSIVIDVGTSFLKSKSGKGKLKGDVEFEKALPRASFITPVPGGVGPVTVAMLMKNTFHCARLNSKVNPQRRTS